MTKNPFQKEGMFGKWSAWKEGNEVGNVEGYNQAREDIEKACKKLNFTVHHTKMMLDLVPKKPASQEGV